MGKKILPIIIDDDNFLARSLTAINIAYLYCNTNDDKMYSKLNQGYLRYANKYFLTRNVVIALKLYQDFSDNSIYFIGTPQSKLPIDIEVYENVNEPVLRYISEGTMYYSMKDIRNFKCNTLESFRKSIKMNIVLTGEIDNNISITNIRKIMRTLKNNRLLKNQYIINEVRTFYCGLRNDFFTKNLNIDAMIELQMPKNDEESLDIVECFTHTVQCNLIDRNIYFNHWRALNQLLDCVYSVDDDGSHSRVKGNYKNVNLFQGSDVITIVINVSRLSKKMKMIYVSEEICDIISRSIIADPTTEIIYLHSDAVAIGTSKIMNHYMSLYNLYGTYDFKSNIRTFDNDGIFAFKEYSEMNDYYGLKSDAQLFEHMHAFTDIVVSHILPISKNSHIQLKTTHMILVTYHGIYEQFIYIKESLEKLGYTVHDYPYLTYNNDGGENKLLEEMKKLMDKYDVSYVLWWTLNIDVDVLHNICKYNENIKHLYFNWDEPYNWDKINASIKSKYISSAFITCKETTERYKIAGSRNSYCVYTGYSPLIHYPFWINLDSGKDLGHASLDYDFDISFICTNLYEDLNEYPDQIINRKELVETIYNNQEVMGYKFAIFGPEKFRDIFPKSYQYFIPYNKTGEMFNRSKINICTHVVGNKNGYLNERVFLIMASGGLLMVDPIPGVSDILVNGRNCVYIDQKRILTQIRMILSNYNTYHIFKKRAYDTARKYTWDHWAMRIQESLLKDYTSK